MKKLFPEMTVRLDTGHMICALAYWLLCFLLFPFFIPILAMGVQRDRTVLSWVEIVFCAINGGVMIGVLKEQLSDGVLSIQVTLKGFRKLFWICLAATGLMVAYSILIAPLAGFLAGVPMDYSLNFFPITEMAVAVLPGAAVYENPIFATAVFSALSPFAVCGLFYAPVFGPICCRSRWLGYPAIAVLLALPAAFTWFWRGQPEVWIAWYLYQLPVHLLACWTYQKTDNAWAPIISLGMFNLISSLLVLI